MMPMQQVQAKLQQLPDAALQQLMQGNNPGVPQFYVMAELSRRSRMRLEAAGSRAPDTTVKASMEQAPSQAPERFASGGDTRKKPFWLDQGTYRAPTVDVTDALAPTVDPYGSTSDYARQMQDKFDSMSPSDQQAARNKFALASAAADRKRTQDAAAVDAARLYNPYAHVAPIPTAGWTMSDTLKKTPPTVPAPTVPAKPDTKVDDVAAGTAAQNAMYAQLFPTEGYTDIKLERPTLIDPTAFKRADTTADTRKEIDADRADLAVQKKRDWNNMLMQAGSAIMSDRSRTPQGWLAAGVKAGLGTYNADTDARRAVASKLKAQERGLDKEAETIAWQNAQEQRMADAGRNQNVMVGNEIGNKERMINATNRINTNHYNLQAQASLAHAKLSAMSKTKVGVPEGLKNQLTALQSAYGALIGKATDEASRAAITAEHQRRTIELINSYHSGIALPDMGNPDLGVLDSSGNDMVP